MTCREGCPGASQKPCTGRPSKSTTFSDTVTGCGSGSYHTYYSGSSQSNQSKKPTFFGCLTGACKWSDYLRIPRGVGIKWGDVPGNRPYDDNMKSSGTRSYSYYTQSGDSDSTSGGRNKSKRRQNPDEEVKNETVLATYLTESQTEKPTFDLEDNPEEAGCSSKRATFQPGTPSYSVSVASRGQSPFSGPDNANNIPGPSALSSTTDGSSGAELVDQVPSFSSQQLQTSHSWIPNNYSPPSYSEPPGPQFHQELVSGLQKIDTSTTTMPHTDSVHNQKTQLSNQSAVQNESNLVYVSKYQEHRAPDGAPQVSSVSPQKIRSPTHVPVVEEATFPEDPPSKSTLHNDFPTTYIPDTEGHFVTDADQMELESWYSQNYPLTSPDGEQTLPSELITDSEQSRAFGNETTVYQMCSTNLGHKFPSAYSPVNGGPHSSPVILYSQIQRQNQYLRTNGQHNRDNPGPGKVTQSEPTHLSVRRRQPDDASTFAARQMEPEYIFQASNSRVDQELQHLCVGPPVNCSDHETARQAPHSRGQLVSTYPVLTSQQHVPSTRGSGRNNTTTDPRVANATGGQKHNQQFPVTSPQQPSQGRQPTGCGRPNNPSTEPEQTFVPLLDWQQTRPGIYQYSSSTSNTPFRQQQVSNQQPDWLQVPSQNPTTKAPQEIKVFYGSPIVQSPFYAAESPDSRPKPNQQPIYVRPRGTRTPNNPAPMNKIPTEEHSPSYQQFVYHQSGGFQSMLPREEGYNSRDNSVSGYEPSHTGQVNREPTMKQTSSFNEYDDLSAIEERKIVHFLRRLLQLPRGQVTHLPEQYADYRDRINDQYVAMRTETQVDQEFHTPTRDNEKELPTLYEEKQDEISDCFNLISRARMNVSPKILSPLDIHVDNVVDDPTFKARAAKLGQHFTSKPENSSKTQKKQTQLSNSTLNTKKIKAKTKQEEISKNGNSILSSGTVVNQSVTPISSSNIDNGYTAPTKSLLGRKNATYITGERPLGGRNTDLERQVAGKNDCNQGNMSILPNNIDRGISRTHNTKQIDSKSDNNQLNVEYGRNDGSTIKIPEVQVRTVLLEPLEDRLQPLFLDYALENNSYLKQMASIDDAFKTPVYAVQNKRSNTKKSSSLNLDPSTNVELTLTANRDTKMTYSLRSDLKYPAPLRSAPPTTASHPSTPPSVCDVSSVCPMTEEEQESSCNSSMFTIHRTQEALPSDSEDSSYSEPPPSPVTLPATPSQASPREVRPSRYSFPATNPSKLRFVTPVRILKTHLGTTFSPHNYIIGRPVTVTEVKSGPGSNRLSDMSVHSKQRGKPPGSETDKLEEIAGGSEGCTVDPRHMDLHRLERQKQGTGADKSASVPEETLPEETSVLQEEPVTSSPVVCQVTGETMRAGRQAVEKDKYVVYLTAKITELENNLHKLEQYMNKCKSAAVTTIPETVDMSGLTTVAEKATTVTTVKAEKKTSSDKVSATEPVVTSSIATADTLGLATVAKKRRAQVAGRVIVTTPKTDKGTTTKEVSATEPIATSNTATVESSGLGTVAEKLRAQVAERATVATAKTEKRKSTNKMAATEPVATLNTATAESSGLVSVAEKLSAKVAERVRVTTAKAEKGISTEKMSATERVATSDTATVLSVIAIAKKSRAQVVERVKVTTAKVDKGTSIEKVSAIKTESAPHTSGSVTMAEVSGTTSAQPEGVASPESGVVPEDVRGITYGLCAQEWGPKAGDKRKRSCFHQSCCDSGISITSSMKTTHSGNKFPDYDRKYNHEGIFYQDKVVSHLISPKRVRFNYTGTQSKIERMRGILANQKKSRNIHDKQVYSLYNIVRSGDQHAPFFPTQLCMSSKASRPNENKPPSIKLENSWSYSKLNVDQSPPNKFLADEERRIMNEIICLGLDERNHFLTWDTLMPLLPVLPQKGRLREDSSMESYYGKLHWSNPGLKLSETTQLASGLESQRLELMEMKQLLYECVKRLRAARSGGATPVESRSRKRAPPGAKAVHASSLCCDADVANDGSSSCLQGRRQSRDLELYCGADRRRFKFKSFVRSIFSSLCPTNSVYLAESCDASELTPEVLVEQSCLSSLTSKSLPGEQFYRRPKTICYQTSVEEQNVSFEKDKLKVGKRYLAPICFPTISEDFSNEVLNEATFSGLHCRKMLNENKFVDVPTQMTGKRIPFENRRNPIYTLSRPHQGNGSHFQQDIKMEPNSNGALIYRTSVKSSNSTKQHFSKHPSEYEETYDGVRLPSHVNSTEGEVHDPVTSMEDNNPEETSQSPGRGGFFRRRMASLSFKRRLHPSDRPHTFRKRKRAPEGSERPSKVFVIFKKKDNTGKESGTLERGSSGSRHGQLDHSDDDNAEHRRSQPRFSVFQNRHSIPDESGGSEQRNRLSFFRNRKSMSNDNDKDKERRYSKRNSIFKTRSKEFDEDGKTEKRRSIRMPSIFRKTHDNPDYSLTADRRSSSKRFSVFGNRQSEREDNDNLGHRHFSVFRNRNSAPHDSDDANRRFSTRRSLFRTRQSNQSDENNTRRKEFDEDGRTEKRTSIRMPSIFRKTHDNPDYSFTADRGSSSKRFSVFRNRQSEREDNDNLDHRHFSVFRNRNRAPHDSDDANRRFSTRPSLFRTRQSNHSDENNAHRKSTCNIFSAITRRRRDQGKEPAVNREISPQRLSVSGSRRDPKQGGESTSHEQAVNDDVISPRASARFNSPPADRHLIEKPKYHNAVAYPVETKSRVSFQQPIGNGAMRSESAESESAPAQRSVPQRFKTSRHNRRSSRKTSSLDHLEREEYAPVEQQEAVDQNRRKGKSNICKLCRHYMCGCFLH